MRLCHIMIANLRHSAFVPFFFFLKSIFRLTCICLPGQSLAYCFHLENNNLFTKTLYRPRPMCSNFHLTWREAKANLQWQFRHPPATVILQHWWIIRDEEMQKIAKVYGFETLKISSPFTVLWPIFNHFRCQLELQ